MLHSLLSPTLPPPPPTVTTTIPGTQTNLASLISSATSLSHLKQIHAQILRSTSPGRHHEHLFQLLLSSLSYPSYALSLLSYIPSNSSPTFQLSNKIINHLSRSTSRLNVLLFFQIMMAKGFPMDRFCFPPLLKAASKSMALSEGRMIHALAAKFGYDSDPYVETAMVGMYAACGLISEARLVFDKMSHRDIVAWNIAIDGYCQSNLFDDALSLLQEMKRFGIEPDGRVLTTILSACARFKNVSAGRVVHEFITENSMMLDSQTQTALLNMYANSGSMDVAETMYYELNPKNVVASTAMITGHSKHGNIEAARLIFDEIVDRDLVCWSAIISGYAESDKPQEALNLFHDMLKCGIKPDQVTMLSVISACAHFGALDHARQIHAIVDGEEFGKSLPIRNALIDMYAKCGSLQDAKEVFVEMRRRNVISWTSMINAFAVHGDAENALKHFNQMKLRNVDPNWVTFVAVLNACSHAGLVDEGKMAFDTMVNEYGIKPRLEHYGCLVDLYGRANRLSCALEIVETMPMAPNIVIWGSLMAACRIHGDFELGDFAAKQVLKLDPDHDGAHIFLSNMYAKESCWENVGSLRQFMREKGISKERGCSTVEISGVIHKFLTADKNHEDADKVYGKLYELVDKLKQVGYAPDTRSVLVDLDEDEKREVVLWHSEKLALCYGLIHKEERNSIRIIKNLRICEDCHTFMKLASKVLDREIIIRDRTRFHHFRDGSCSCRDFW